MNKIPTEKEFEIETMLLENPLAKLELEELRIGDQSLLQLSKSHIVTKLWASNSGENFVIKGSFEMNHREKKQEENK